MTLPQHLSQKNVANAHRNVFMHPQNWFNLEAECIAIVHYIQCFMLHMFLSCQYLLTFSVTASYFTGESKLIGILY